MSTEDHSQTVWRFEIINPQTLPDWRPLWREFAEDQLAAAQELIHELNRINAPVRLRIVPHQIRRNIVVKCAWCGDMSQSLGDETPEEVSHTICNACRTKLV